MCIIIQVHANVVVHVRYPLTPPAPPREKCGDLSTYAGKWRPDADGCEASADNKSVLSFQMVPSTSSLPPSPASPPSSAVGVTANFYTRGPPTPTVCSPPPISGHVTSSLVRGPPTCVYHQVTSSTANQVAVSAVPHPPLGVSMSVQDVRHKKKPTPPSVPQPHPLPHPHRNGSSVGHPLPTATPPSSPPPSPSVLYRKSRRSSTHSLQEQVLRTQLEGRTSVSTTAIGDTSLPPSTTATHAPRCGLPTAPPESAPVISGTNNPRPYSATVSKPASHTTLNGTSGNISSISHPSTMPVQTSYSLSHHDSATRTQPSHTPHNSATPTQPSHTPHNLATPTQPSHTPHNLATPTQPSHTPHNSATPTQPSHTPHRGHTRSKSLGPFAVFPSAQARVPSAAGPVRRRHTHTRNLSAGNISQATLTVAKGLDLRDTPELSRSSVSLSSAFLFDSQTSQAPPSNPKAGYDFAKHFNLFSPFTSNMALEYCQAEESPEVHECPAPAVWCMDVWNNSIAVGCGNGQIEVGVV